jgi:hypothetical protein
MQQQQQQQQRESSSPSEPVVPVVVASTSRRGATTRKRISKKVLFCYILAQILGIALALLVSVFVVNGSFSLNTPQPNLFIQPNGDIVLNELKVGKSEVVVILPGHTPLQVSMPDEGPDSLQMMIILKEDNLKQTTIHLARDFVGAPIKTKIVHQDPTNQNAGLPQPGQKKLPE